MSWSLSLVMLAGTMTAAAPERVEFESYTEAYYAAKEAKKPLLVILNPAEDADGQKIALSDVKKTAERRELLENYVVAVIDTSTDHGKKVNELFGSPELPRVSVIDNEQQWQVYRTSDQLQGYQWTEVLNTFKDGKKQVRTVRYNYCPSCQRRGYTR